MHDHHEHDATDLATFGYAQRLNRTLGGFSSFAAGFSYLSILTGMFQLFGFGYGFAGPGVMWAWLFVFGGQLCVALNFAELGAHYPIAGSVYQWSKRISRPLLSWLAGWTMLIGSVVTVAAVAIALQVVLPTIWSGFQVFNDSATNAVFFGSVLIALTTIVNAVGVRIMAKINNFGVMAELLGAVLIIILLFAHAKRGPGVVATTQGAGPGLPGYHSLGFLAALLLAAVMPAYVMFGFDTACSLAEETRDPRKRTPWAVLQALGAAGVAGALLLLGALMATPKLSITTLGSGGLPLVLQSALGSTLGKILLADVAVAICVCTLAIQTASVRLAFAMARDGRLPFSDRLSHVNEHSHSPVLASAITGVIAIAILIVNIGSSQIFLVVTSVSIVIIYVAYLLVTGPLLIQRLSNWPAREGRSGLFALGPVGVLINLLAVGYGAFMAINLVWPRSLIYGSGKAWGGVIVVGAVVVIGLAYYLAFQRTKEIEIGLEHRSSAAPGDPAGPPDAASFPATPPAVAYERGAE